MPEVSVVVLTMGDRPTELAAAVASARDQDLDLEVVLVVNGGEPDHTLADIVLEPGENVGIPEGRNLGAAAATSDLICFLDDDGELFRDVLAQTYDAFTTEPDLAVIGLRVVDETGATARRHVPGLRKRPERSGPATAFPGGACVVRNAAFREVGGLCGPFQYGLEETDLAWRLLDGGWDVRYRADLQMRHPRTTPTRHAAFFFGTARNRVWLAYRSLPLPLAITYILMWSLITAARNIHSPNAIAGHARGTVAGLRNRVGPRRPMAWRTVLELCRRGRPPVV